MPSSPIRIVLAAAVLCGSTGLGEAATGGSTGRSIAPEPSASRPYAPALTCGALAGLVARSGAVVISTGPTTYDRIVRDGSFCPIEETTEAEYLRSADVERCFAGYRCHQRFNEGVGRD